MIPHETQTAQHPHEHRTISVGRRLSDADRIIGMHLRAARRERRLSQLAIADSVGLSFPQIQKYETGENRITVSTFIRIAHALGVAPHALMASVCADIEGTPDASYRRTIADCVHDGIRAAPAQNGISSGSNFADGRGSAS